MSVSSSGETSMADLDMTECSQAKMADCKKIFTLYGNGFSLENVPQVKNGQNRHMIN
jgi:hypothetical protein